ncbi:MAG: hypothetical protein AAB250_14805 [Bdellovibrionota bacterium]
MVAAAVLTADQRLQFQIHSWMKELGDAVQLENFSDLKAFATKIETEVIDESAQKSKDDDAPLDAEDIGSGKSSTPAQSRYYGLLIVDVDMLLAASERPLTWSTTIKTLLVDRGRSDPLVPTKILLMSFESGSIKPESFRHEAIDDLILKPLDRSLFLQKVEILAAEKPGIKPSFLFRQNTAMDIEVGKDVMVDEISEFAVAIRNPAPLAEGVFAAIHCEVFGDRGLGRILARSYKSERHPTIEGEFLVRFGYFGVSTAQLDRVKKYIRAQQMPNREKKPRGAALNVDDPPVPFNRVAIIDMDRMASKEIASTINDHYLGVAVTMFPSYARFLFALNKLAPVKQQAPVQPVVQTPAVAELMGPPNPFAKPPVPEKIEDVPPWPGKGSLTFLLGGSDNSLVRFVSGTGKKDDLVFGRTADEWVERPADWLSEIDKDDRDDFQQLIDYVRGGGKGYALIRIRDEDEHLYYLEANGAIEKSGDADGNAILKIELRRHTEDDWKALRKKVSVGDEALDPSEFRYDAIFIDGSLIRGEVPSWMDGLSEMLITTGVFNRGDAMPKIVILAEEKSRLKPEAFRFKAIGDFIFKPLERKFFSYKVKTLIPELVPRGEPDMPPFVPCEIPAKLAKNAKMEEVSEYGLTISHPSPFRGSVYMRFFSPLFGDNSDGVIGRCTHCDKKQGEGEGFACHFTFFGTPDEVLKRIRTWIREDYVQRKEGS